MGRHEIYGIALLLVQIPGQVIVPVMKGKQIHFITTPGQAKVALH